jgi:hypothetical protein
LIGRSVPSSTIISGDVHKNTRSTRSSCTSETPSDTQHTALQFRLETILASLEDARAEALERFRANQIEHTA